MMLPAAVENFDQFVPNWKLITMPDTTPMPNETAKMRSQKKYRSRMWSSRLRSHSASRNASHHARPMVNARKQDMERHDESELDARKEFGVGHRWIAAFATIASIDLRCDNHAIINRCTEGRDAAICRVFRRSGGERVARQILGRVFGTGDIVLDANAAIFAETIDLIPIHIARGGFTLSVPRAACR